MGLGGLRLNLQIPGLVLPCGQSLLGGQQDVIETAALEIPWLINSSLL